MPEFFLVFESLYLKKNNNWQNKKESTEYKLQAIIPIELQVSLQGKCIRI